REQESSRSSKRPKEERCERLHTSRFADDEGEAHCPAERQDELRIRESFGHATKDDPDLPDEGADPERRRKKHWPDVEPAANERERDGHRDETERGRHRVFRLRGVPR